jgi:hypothetical protein
MFAIKNMLIQSPIRTPQLTAEEVLELLLTVDGVDSELDAATLGGLSSSEFPTNIAVISNARAIIQTQFMMAQTEVRTQAL